MPWLVLGLSGFTNSGKTTLATRLKEIYPTAVILRQDDYFLPESDPRHSVVEGLGHINWELLSSIDMDKFYEDIREIIQTDEPGFQLLILDGFLLFNDPRVSAVCSIKVFLEIDYETCRNRRLLRSYDPPDVPGYFETVVWPSAITSREKALLANPEIVLLEGTLPLQVLQDIVTKIIKRYLSTFN